MNHEYHRNLNTFSAKWVEHNAAVVFGATGAPTLDKWVPYTPTTSGGYATASTTGYAYILSVVRNGTGDFSINFVVGDSTQRLLRVEATFFPGGFPTAGSTAGLYPLAGSAPAAPLWYVKQALMQPVPGNSGYVRVQFGNASQTATDPASGEGVLFTFVFDDSTAT